VVLPVARPWNQTLCLNLIYTRTRVLYDYSHTVSSRYY
jgi:hypothetical protein